MDLRASASCRKEFTLRIDATHMWRLDMYLTLESLISQTLRQVRSTLGTVVVPSGPSTNRYQEAFSRMLRLE